MGKIYKCFVLLLYIASLSSFLASDNVKYMKQYYVHHKTLPISDDLAKNIAFGLTATSGTTNTLNVNGRFRTFVSFEGIEGEPFKILFDSKAYLSKSNHKKNNEEYRIDINFEQSFGSSWLVYGAFSWLRNTFKNYDAYFTYNIGIGKSLINDESHLLTLKFGLGYNKEIYSNEQVAKTYLSFNQYLEYHYKLSKQDYFYIKIAVLENIEDFSKDYEILSVLGFDFMLGDNFSFSIEQEIYYDALRPEGDHTVDTRTVAKIGYRF